MGATMADRPIRVIVFKPADRKFFQAQWTDPETGRKRTKSTGTSIKRDAERWAAKLEGELKDGDTQQLRTTWADFKKRVDRDFMPEKRPNTQTRYRSAISAVEKQLNPKLVTAIDVDAVNELKAKLRDIDNSEATVAAHLRHLKSLLRWGQRQGLLRKIPHIEIPVPEVPARGHPIVGEEFERLLLAVPKVIGADRSPSWCYLLKGLYLGGLRIGEAVRLTWDDPEGVRVDLEREFPLLYIPARLQKGRRDTVTPITPDFADLLRETPPETRTGFVFNPLPGSNKKMRLTQNQIQYVIRDIGKKAGIVTKRQPVEYVTAHDLRRSFCFRWAQRILPQHLRVLARHRAVETTLKYYAEADAGQTAEAVWGAMVVNKIANTPDSANAQIDVSSTGGGT